MQRLMSVLLLVAACGGDGGNSQMIPDAPASVDAGASSDSAGFQGLTIQWLASPAVPGPQNLPTMVEVTSAKFHVEKLEAISDGGAVPETTLREFDLEWSATTTPEPIFFTSAPPAIYSKIRLGLEKGASNAPSIEIRGTVLVGGSTEAFVVSTTQKADLEIGGYAVTLGIGGSETMPVIVGLDALLADVDWMALPTTSGTRTLDDTQAMAVDDLLDRLEDTFTSPLE